MLPIPELGLVIHMPKTFSLAASIQKIPTWQESATSLLKIMRATKLSVSMTFYCFSKFKKTIFFYFLNFLMFCFIARLLFITHVGYTLGESTYIWLYASFLLQKITRFTFSLLCETPKYGRFNFFLAMRKKCLFLSRHKFLEYLRNIVK